MIWLSPYEQMQLKDLLKKINEMPEDNVMDINKEASINGTRLTLQNENGTYSTHIEDEGMTIWDLRDNVLIPLLLAAGYQPGTLDELFRLDEDFDEPESELTSSLADLIRTVRELEKEREQNEPDFNTQAPPVEYFERDQEENPFENPFENSFWRI